MNGRPGRAERHHRPESGAQHWRLIVAELGAKGSLARRFARLDEIETVWRPRKPDHEATVFGHLLSTPPSLPVPAAKITWAKFCREVLPNAKIQLKVPASGSFAAMVTATHPDAPPIIQWDREERRNPVSGYLYANGSLATNWSLDPGAWADVTAVALQPSQWFDGDYPHQGESVFFLLQGARDRCDEGAGLGLFPEILRSELHGVRATIEAYSRRAVLTNTSGELASGIKFAKGQSAPLTLRVTRSHSESTTFEYVLDRWD